MFNPVSSHKRSYESSSSEGSSPESESTVRRIFQLTKRIRIDLDAMDAAPVQPRLFEQPRTAIQNEMDLVGFEQAPIVEEPEEEGAPPQLSVYEHLGHSTLCIANGFSSSNEIVSLLQQKIYSNFQKACIVADALINHGSTFLLINGYELEFTTSEAQPIDDPRDGFEISNTDQEIAFDISHRNTRYRAVADVSKFV